MRTSGIAPGGAGAGPGVPGADTLTMLPAVANSPLIPARDCTRNAPVTMMLELLLLELPVVMLELVLEVVISHLGNTSCVSRHRVLRGEEALVEGDMRHVIVDRESLQKTPIPSWLREALTPWALEELASS